MRGSWAVVSAFALILGLGPANGESGREIVRRSLQSVVVVTTESPGGDPLSLGTGFFVARDLIVTNFHVVDGATRVSARVVGGGERLAVDGVVAADPVHDLAVVRLFGQGASPLDLGRSDSVAVGDSVYVIGNPEGLEGTVSTGVVSAIRSTASGVLMQMTAPVSPGSSGGPVLNTKGEVVGVAAGAMGAGQNLNFAVPVSYVSDLLRRVAELNASPRLAGKKTQPRGAPGARTSCAGSGTRGESEGALAACRALATAGDAVSAERACRDSLVRDTDNVEARYYLAVVLGRKGNWEDAANELRRAIVLDPKNPQLHVNLAIALDHLGRREDAALEFREALSLEPTDPLLADLFGKFLLLKADDDRAGERWDEALAEYSEVLSLLPEGGNLADAHYGLGLVRRHRGDLDGAVREFGQALRLNPKLDQAHAALSQVLLHKGDIEGAVAEMEEAVRLNPDSPLAHVILGNLYEAEGRPAKANEELRKAYLLAPNDPHVREEYERILHQQKP